jgi:hypothetical protein
VPEQLVRAENTIAKQTNNVRFTKLLFITNILNQLPIAAVPDEILSPPAECLPERGHETSR